MTNTENVYPKFKVVYTINNIQKITTISAKGIDMVKGIVYISESETARKEGVICGKIGFNSIEEVF